MTSYHPVQTEFDRRSSSYDQNAHAQMDTIQWAKGLIPKPISNDSYGLELGAGTGNWSLELYNAGYKNLRVTDYSQSPLNEAKKKFQSLENDPPIQFQIFDAWNPSQYQQSSYDFVSSANLLQWAPFFVKENFLQFHELLKPNAISFHLMPIKPTLSELYEILPDASPFQWLAEDDWLNEFEKNNMEVIFAETQSKEYHFPNLLSLLRGIHATGATVKKNPPELRKLIRSNNQPISITWKSLFIISKKRI